MKHVGQASNGSKIMQINLERAGLSVKLLSLGACLQDLRINSYKHSLVLGYPDINSYFSNINYFGATIGPFANRLANGRTIALGKTIELDRNTLKGDHLHGGLDGVHSQNWDVVENSDYHVIFKLNLQNKLELGDTSARRDWLHAKDAVMAIHLMLQSSKPSDYIIAVSYTHLTLPTIYSV